MFKVKISHVSKSSKFSIVKGLVHDLGTRLTTHVRARTREGEGGADAAEDAGRKLRGASFSIALMSASALPPQERVPLFSGQVVDGKAAIHFRELSVTEWHELYENCRRYATSWFRRYGMPTGELGDTISAASDDAYERVCGTPVVRNLPAFMRVTAYKAVAQAIRRRKSRENLVWIDSLPLTMPDRDETNADDELNEEGFFASDCGAGAERIVQSAECSDCSIEPPWLRLFRRVLGRQKGKAKKVIAALKKDSRPAVAAQLSAIPKRTFWRNLKKIRDDFAQCYQAYRRSRGERRVAHFSFSD